MKTVEEIKNEKKRNEYTIGVLTDCLRHNFDEKNNRIMSTLAYAEAVKVLGIENLKVKTFLANTFNVIETVYSTDMRNNHNQMVCFVFKQIQSATDVICNKWRAANDKLLGYA